MAYVFKCFISYFLQWKSQSETVYFDTPSSHGFAQNRSADSFVDNLQAPRPFFAGSSSASGFHRSEERRVGKECRL